MTVSEVIELNKGQYTYIELFIGLYGNKTSFQTDKISVYSPNNGYGDCKSGQEERLNSYILTDNVLTWSLMDIDEYNNTVLSKTSVDASRYGYEDKDKILCILVQPSGEW
ncbi:MAG: hypothetical protein KBS84_06365 [Treponema sp.]|nr:hypothetical protein [Candidatus Treponema scatequi]